MAKKSDIPTDLTLDIKSALNPDAFVAAVRNFFGYINEITASQDKHKAVKWTVKVKEGSSLIALEPDTAVPVEMLRPVYEKARHGIACLHEGDLEKSALSEKAISHLKVLSQLTGKNGSSDNVKLWIEKKAVNVGPQIAEFIREEWKTDYHDYGSIEGRLDTIQDTSGNLRIRIKDVLYQTPVKCVLPDAMLKEALAAFAKRVELVGLVHFRKNGTPTSIDVSELVVLPEDDTLPDFDDIRGLLAAS